MMDFPKEQKQISPSYTRFKSIFNTNPIISAVLQQDLPALKEALQPPDEKLLNQQDKRGQTPLHIAVLQGNIPIIQELLIAGAKWDILDKQDRSPLDWCKQFLKSYLPKDDLYKKHKMIFSFLQFNIIDNYEHNIFDAQASFEEDADILKGAQQLLLLAQIFKKLYSECLLFPRENENIKPLQNSLIYIEHFKKILRRAISQSTQALPDSDLNKINALLTEIDHLLRNFFPIYDEITGVIDFKPKRDEKLKLTSKAEIEYFSVKNACQYSLIKIDVSATSKQIDLLYEQIKDSLDTFVVLIDPKISEVIKNN